MPGSGLGRELGRGACRAGVQLWVQRVHPHLQRVPRDAQIRRDPSQRRTRRRPIQVDSLAPELLRVVPTRHDRGSSRFPGRGRISACPRSRVKAPARTAGVPTGPPCSWQVTAGTHRQRRHVLSVVNRDGLGGGRDAFGADESPVQAPHQRVASQVRCPKTPVAPSVDGAWQSHTGVPMGDLVIDREAADLQRPGRDRATGAGPARSGGRLAAGASPAAEAVEASRG